MLTVLFLLLTAVPARLRKSDECIDSIVTDILSKSNPLTKRGFYFRLG